LEGINIKNLKRKERIQKLRERFLSFKPEICVERAQLITESYMQTEGEPTILRRAKALKKILEGISIDIGEKELIVGNLAITPRSAPIYPEYSVNWVLDELDDFETRPGDKFLISEEKKNILRDILPYWRGKTVEERALIYIPEEAAKFIDIVYLSTNMLTGGIGHSMPDYALVLNEGINGIKRRIQKKIRELDFTDPQAFKKRQYYRASLIVCEAIIEFANRYAEKAEELSSLEINSQRKEELARIAEVCRYVPANPSRNFYEALQSFWFVELVFYLEANGLSISPGRFDQYIYPFYKKDIEKGVISKEEAQELLECLWIKFPQIIKLYNNSAATAYGGFPTNQCIILGGINEKGEDVTNELSYMCLEATANTKLTDPSLAVRIHKKTPQSFLSKICEVIKLGGGMPKIFNDEIIIPAMLNRGIPLEEARNYAIVGCVEPVVPGKSFNWSNAGYFNLVKCLELSLNNGVCKQSNQRLGPETGDFVNFCSFEELLGAYKKQVEYFVRQMVISINAIDVAQRELGPLPAVSLFIDDCIEKGEDVTAGGARYNFTGPQGVGIANVGDSLAAIKKLVFEEKKININELKEAIDNNFEKREKLRQMLLNQAPKYGNDIDYVDFLARDVGVLYCKEVEKYHNPRGGRYQPGLYPVTANIPMGKVVEATPDGRRAGEPLADGISPVQGRDLQGPTAVLLSVAKIEHIKASNGTLLNMKFPPDLLEGEKNAQKFSCLLRAFVDLGIWHVQFNVVSEKTLRDAQEHPDKYPDLIVRVAGYSAFFVELDREVQDDIISRTEQRVM